MKHGFSLHYKRYMISTFTVPRSIAVPIKKVINFYGFVLNILFTLLYVIPCMGGILKINIKNADRNYPFRCYTI